jgi:hypothetical protein
MHADLKLNEKPKMKLQQDYDREINRRIDLVMSALIQEFFLRSKKLNIHPLEILNKIMILIQYPLAFSICKSIRKKTKKKTTTEIVETRSFIKNDLFGGDYTQILQNMINNTKIVPFTIFDNKRSEITYSLYVVIVKTDGKQDTYFQPISKNLSYHRLYKEAPENIVHSHNLEEQISATIQQFFGYFKSNNSEIVGMKDSFIKKVHDGLHAFFKASVGIEDSTINGSELNNKDNTVVPDLKDFYSNLEGEVLRTVYSSKIKNFSLTIKELTEPNQSHSNLPNIIMHSRTMKLPGEVKRAQNITSNETKGSFEGYNFNTKIIGSDSQREDITEFLVNLKEGYLNCGGDAYLKSVDILPYSSLAESSTPPNDKDIMLSYDELFKRILTEEITVELETGDIKVNTKSYSDNHGIQCLIDIYFNHTANERRGLSDSVFTSGIIMIRFPFDRAGGLGLIGGKRSTIETKAQKCDLDILFLVVVHYVFEGLSPLSKDRDNSTLALITFPIYISGRVPVTVSHLLHIERKSLHDIKALDDNLVISSGTWDQVYYLNQFLGKEIKSNLRRGYWKHYIHEMELIFEDEIYKALAEGKKDNLPQTFLNISTRIASLTYYYPFAKINVVEDMELSEENPKVAYFAGIGFSCKPYPNNNFVTCAAGTPYLEDLELSSQTIEKQIKIFLKGLETTIINQFLFGRTNTGTQINPNSYLTERLIVNLHSTSADFLLEYKKSELRNIESNELTGEVNDVPEELTQFATTLITNKRIKILNLLHKAHKAKFKHKVIDDYYKPTDLNPVNYLRNTFGEYLNVFNGGNGDYFYYEELMELDYQFVDTLNKFLARNEKNKTGKFLTVGEYIPKKPKNSRKRKPKKTQSKAV